MSPSSQSSPSLASLPSPPPCASSTNGIFDKVFTFIGSIDGNGDGDTEEDEEEEEEDVEKEDEEEEEDEAEEELDWPAVLADCFFSCFAYLVMKSTFLFFDTMGSEDSFALISTSSAAAAAAE